jgi:hypothetical protein
MPMLVAFRAQVRDLLLTSQAEEAQWSQHRHAPT